MQLHTAGIGLWNRSVALKSAGAIALNLNAQCESGLQFPLETVRKPLGLELATVHHFQAIH